MKLKYILTSLEGLDDSVKSLYAEKEGKFYLQVDGAVDKDKLNEFRENNISLKKEIEALKESMEGFDPEKMKELQEIERKAREKELLEKGDVEAIVEERIKSINKNHATELETLNSRLLSANGQLESLLIDNTVRKLASEKGVIPSAVDDVLLRARALYTLKDGKPTAMEDGKIKYGRDGLTPLPIDEWVLSLKETASHLFHQPKGSGAHKDSGSGSGIDTKNMTAMQKIVAGLDENS